MAIKLDKVEGFLSDLGIKFKKKDEETVAFPMSSDGEEILIIIKLLEDGEYIQIRTVKHLDDLVAEADEEKRIELLKWMLNENYTKKLGTWEYDPADHDHHIAVGFVIEDGDLTKTQFMRMFRVISNSVDKIPEMKAILGIADEESYIDRKRADLLRQLQELDDSGI